MASLKGICVAPVLTDLSSDAVLTTEWVQGESACGAGMSCCGSAWAGCPLRLRLHSQLFLLRGCGCLPTSTVAVHTVPNACPSDTIKPRGKSSTQPLPHPQRFKAPASTQSVYENAHTCTGERLQESASPDVRALCTTLLNAYLTQLLDTGFLHADPHPGNLIRTPDGRLCVLDFGLMTEVGELVCIVCSYHVSKFAVWSELCRNRAGVMCRTDGNRAGGLEPSCHQVVSRRRVCMHASLTPEKCRRQGVSAVVSLRWFHLDIAVLPFPGNSPGKSPSSCAQAPRAPRHNQHAGFRRSALGAGGVHRAPNHRGLGGCGP